MERFDVQVLGVTIGTASNWSQFDDFSGQLEYFLPNEEGLKRGLNTDGQPISLEIDYESGAWRLFRFFGTEERTIGEGRFVLA